MDGTESRPVIRAILVIPPRGPPAKSRKKLTMESLDNLREAFPIG
jgi:hypothetical protein